MSLGHCPGSALNNAPLISVIVPCYNAAPFVEETIRSVIDQTYQNWELILIDDGKRDSDARIVHIAERLNERNGVR